jgi:hypothetical protein
MKIKKNIFLLFLINNKNMGLSKSKNLSDTLNSITSSAINNFVSNNENKVTTEITNLNDFTLNIGGSVTGSTITLKQIINSGNKIISNFDTKTSQDLKNDISASLDSMVSQVLKSVSELGGGWGQIEKDDNSQYIKNIINNSIANNTTIINLNKLAIQIVNQNNSTINIRGDLVNSLINVEQNILVQAFVQNLSSNITKSIVDNSISSRLSNIQQQSLTTEKKGFADLVKSFTGPLAIVIIGIIFFFLMGGKTVIERITDWKFLTTIFVFIIIWLIIAYKLQIWPFKKRGPFWGCAMKDKMYNGNCEEKPDEKSGPFKSEDECKNRLASFPDTCPQYWGCDDKDSTSTSPKQYTGIITTSPIITDGTITQPSKVYGIYKSKEEAENNCGSVYYYPLSGQKCIKANRTDQVPSEIINTYKSDDECTKNTQVYCVSRFPDNDNSECSCSKNPTSLDKISTFKTCKSGKNTISTLDPYCFKDIDNCFIAV